MFEWLAELNDMTSTLHAYPVYKPSGVPWLGDLPDHWEIRRLGYLATKFGSGITPRGGATVYQEHGVPFLRSKNVHFDGLRLEDVARITPSLHRELSGSHVRSGDVLLNITGASIGRACSVPVTLAEGNVNQHVCIIRPNQGRLLPGHLAAYLSTPIMQRDIRSEQTGASREGLTLQSIRNFRVVVPPLPEQRAIVRYLDHADRHIRRYVRAKQRLIALLEEERQAVINQAVTRGLDPNVRLKPSGIEWLGDVPEHWEVRRAKTLGRIRYGLGQPPRESAEGVPLIRATNVERGRIVEKDLIRVDPSDVPVGRDALLRAREIIVVRSGAYTADSAIIPTPYEGAVTGYDMVMTITGALPEFMAFALLTSYLRDDQLIVASTRSAQPHLNAEELGAPLVLVPSLPEQAAIVEYLERATAYTNAAIGRARRQSELLQEYRTRLIADVVTGKLDVREAAAQLPDETDDQDPIEEGDLLADDLDQALYDIDESEALSHAEA